MKAQQITSKNDGAKRQSMYSLLKIYDLNRLVEVLSKQMSDPNVVRLCLLMFSSAALIYHIDPEVKKSIIRSTPPPDARHKNAREWGGKTICKSNWISNKQRRTKKMSWQSANPPKTKRKKQKVRCERKISLPLHMDFVWHRLLDMLGWPHKWPLQLIVMCPVQILI